MNPIRTMAKPVSIFLVIFMIMTFIPYQSALAKMVRTETVIELNRVQEAREYVNTILAREDIRASLISQGIDIQEAIVRVNSLADSEIISLADQIEKAPAGQGALGTIVFAAVLVFLVLLFTDIAGYTDIFPFVKKSK